MVSTQYGEGLFGNLIPRTIDWAAAAAQPAPTWRLREDAPPSYTPPPYVASGTYGAGNGAAGSLRPAGDTGVWRAAATTAPGAARVDPRDRADDPDRIGANQGGYYDPFTVGDLVLRADQGDGNAAWTLRQIGYYDDANRKRYSGFDEWARARGLTAWRLGEQRPAGTTTPPAATATNGQTGGTNVSAPMGSGMATGATSAGTAPTTNVGALAQTMYDNPMQRRSRILNALGIDPNNGSFMANQYRKIMPRYGEQFVNARQVFGGTAGDAVEEFVKLLGGDFIGGMRQAGTQGMQQLGTLANGMQDEDVLDLLSSLAGMAYTGNDLWQGVAGNLTDRAAGKYFQDYERDFRQSGRVPTSRLYPALAANPELAALLGLR